MNLFFLFFYFFQHFVNINYYRISTPPMRYQLERVSFRFLWEDRLEPYEPIILNSNLRKLEFNYEIDIRIKNL